MMLENKVAVIYGAAGAVGGAVARAFASEGANVFLTGRNRERVDAVADAIVAAGGTAEAAMVDALDEQSIADHLRDVVGRTGRIDVSFNAIGNTDANILGVPLAEMDVEQFSLPVMTYIRSYFLTARVAARHMIASQSGVIMTVSTLHSRTGLPLAGGYGPAQAAKEALTRQLSAELSPQGIRVVGLRPQAMPESIGSRRRFFESRAESMGMSWEQFNWLSPQDPPAAADDPCGNGKCGGLRCLRPGERTHRDLINLTLGSLDD